MNPLNYEDSFFTYDSHTHFFGVGLKAIEFSIDQDSDCLSLPNKLLDQQLIRGFGWTDAHFPTALDQLCAQFPKKNFCLSYHDGHSSFVSMNLIKNLKFDCSDDVKKSKFGVVLSEDERDIFLKLLPKHSDDELACMADYAQKVFLNNKINKVRHLTGNINHWHCLKKLEQLKSLNLEIEVFFSEFMGQSLGEALNSFTKAQHEKLEKVKAVGIKIFYDGSFSAKTAHTSSSCSLGNSSVHNSNTRISKEQLLDKMALILVEKQIPLAVHCIGDLALEDTLKIYSHLHNKHNGKLADLHLEHAPLFSELSLDILVENQLKCIFHFQPSHWIKDHIWYDSNFQMLKPHLIYPFEFLKKNKYEYHFGSDAPIVAPTKENTLKGLKLIEKSREFTRSHLIPLNQKINSGS